MLNMYVTHAGQWSIPNIDYREDNENKDIKSMINKFKIR
jgi:hypothetical protein